MIELDGVTKSYRRGMRGGVTALYSLDLRVEQGTTMAVVGPNGAGKSTLFGIIAGLVRPDRGRVLIDGQPPVGWVRAHGIGLLPDHIRLPPQHSVGESLRRLAILDGCRGGEVATRVGRALEVTGLSGRAKARCGSLSHGLRQRLGIAQLLLRPRSVLLLDEPLSGLDPLWRARFREILADLRSGSQAMTLLISSHELGETARLVDEVAVIREGRLADRFDVGEDLRAFERRVLGVLEAEEGPCGR
jgi:ABC-2 type transport system ATP-binding protein